MRCLAIQPFCLRPHHLAPQALRPQLKRDPLGSQHRSVYILSEQLDREGTGSRDFARYQAYVSDNRSAFPLSAYSLASSTWYFDSRDHRAPHDGRLLSLRLIESSDTDKPTISLETHLQSAYQDGVIVIRYPRVFSYSFSLSDASEGHSDWRYDEFRVAPNGHVLHEIEWWHREETARWLIEANDVQHEWRPS